MHGRGRRAAPTPSTRYLDEGYRRIKLKIEPGWDVEPVRAVRERFGDMPLQVDANAAYTIPDAHHLAGLDPFELAAHRAAAGRGRHARPRGARQGHADADLPRRVDQVGARRGRRHRPRRVQRSSTSSLGASAATSRPAASTTSAGPRRPVWCGGMLETGIGRAANVALAALPNFTLPGDTSASRRYYSGTSPSRSCSRDGRLGVPTGPGIGVSPLPELVERFTGSVRDRQAGLAATAPSRRSCSSITRRSSGLSRSSSNSSTRRRIR